MLFRRRAADPARRPTPEQIAARTDGDDQEWPSPAMLVPSVIGLALVPALSRAAATAVPRLAGGAAGALVTAQFTGRAVGTSVLHGTADTPPWWTVGCLLPAALLAGTTLPSRPLLPQDAEPAPPVVPH
ncbi:hypothetical protein GCM10009759_58480 [Kitasatospora saccharophila]|uniref:Uncharacterized protein n=1 Tax=Kitasatospora saccharophila TaxID=407973 RepID=A0ABN2XPF4_9ACTN